ncbi:bifunctional diaminohydroxyphosphoribosylaminopyrimidine deaminase/5-amino-6-(5-phosphoribosylamino)uracil reductase RibD [Maricaulis sp.]|uniref:bifunctional diaminohydroxyphosphoribosylaminopyrimidine deaminase/5-amino-6-(5-phosphoribosylamino)uracil reductase RibD n=1 Tax=Maricaulis sp. TaxID=1486257 RepID=UPI002630FE9A|nr:bifunctional diaminohydroxyphosphoribosylaminopyrimidine deaminase/5-amino-6-(5-phosphoribosylamino)uracil reductase RibD [Maricaulis sp.]
MTGTDDLRYMGLALALARGQLGRTAPNPAVGCVLVRDGRILATGATADGGRPHAERIALDRAGDGARGATAYVTLEPCAHHGQTPPCALGLIEAGAARVVVASPDRYVQVDGRGVAMLRDAGIDVVEGTGRREAEWLYAGFFHRLETGHPLVFADRARRGYEAVLEPVADEGLEAALTALGRAGISRARVEPGSEFAERLLARGLAVRPGHS